MSTVGEAYSTGSVPDDSLAINTRVLGAASTTISGTVALTGSTDAQSYIPVRITDGIGFVGDSRRVNPNNAFGDVVRVELTPVVQIDFSMGIQPSHIRQAIRQDASISLSASSVMLQCGTGSWSYAAVESHDRVRYRPGQGALARWTALYDTPAEGVRAFAGPSNKTSALQFGYSGSMFGIHHQPFSEAHIIEFTVTVPSTTAETVYFMFNGSSGSAVLTNNNSMIQTANEIATSDGFSDVHVHGFQVQASGSKVYFIHRDPEGHTADFSFQATTMSGTYAVITSGSQRNDFFIPQSDWSIDKMDGLGLSAMTLDPSKGNVYQVAFQYLGFGNIIFSIEDERTSKLTPVHCIQWANANVDSVMGSTTLPIAWIIEHTGSTDTTSKFIKGTSAAGFVQGKLVATKDVYSYTVEKALTATPTPIFSLVPFVKFLNLANLGSIKLTSLSLAAEGTKPVRFDIVKDAVVTDPQWTQVREGASAMLVDFSGSVATGGTTVTTVTLGKSDSINIDIERFNLMLHAIPDMDSISVIGSVASNGSSDVIVSITWEELL